VAHYRIPETWRTLGTVPRRVDAPTVGEQLADALASTGVSQNALAQRLAAQDGRKPESKRRWLIKILNDELDAPDMTGIERALSLPSGHFAVPTREQTIRHRVRLEELAAEVKLLRAEQLTFAEEVLARLAGLEAGQGTEARRSTRPSSRKQAGR